MRETAPRRIARLFVVTALLTAGLAGCAVNPVTGARQLALISEGQEVQMGQQAARQVEQTMALVDDPELQAYVAGIGQRLAAASERPGLPWSFKVIDDPVPNAFALPGGPIYVTRGMLTLMDSEAELASVLGHEIGHVTARHSVAQISRAQLAQLGLGLGTILVPELRPFGDLAGTGLGLLLLKYGRDAERQADELGFRYAGAQGYDLTEMADVFVSLARIGELEQRSALPSWLSTHPAPEERVRAVEQRLASLPRRDLDATLGRAEYLGRIDGLAFGENPRHGFFREGTFYHPELEFQFSVPADWKTQNLTQAVVAVSPQRNAALELTLAPDVPPEEALRRFFAQHRLQPVRSGRDTINGIPAALASFQAQTEQGAVGAYVAFLRHEGRTYQLVAYAPLRVFGQVEPTLRRIIGSFAPLTDRAILDIQPPRIEIVRVDRPMTLAEFERRYPSAVPIERLAILNQLAGAEARVEAGTLLKRVVGKPAP